MPKIKALITLFLVIAFSFSLFGCGLVASRGEEQVDLAGTGDELPEWLLLAHRSAGTPETDFEPEMAEAEEEDEADDDTEVNEDSVAEAAQGSTQTAQASGGSQQSSQTEQQSSSSTPEIKPGTREYNLYLQERLPGESTEEWYQRRLAEEADKLQQEESGGFFDGEKGERTNFFDADRESPSGFGS